MKARQSVRMVIPVLMVLSVMAGTVWAETVYVQAKTAQLRAGKTSLDPVVANVKHGEALQVRKTEDKWMEVETGSGITGWIFSNKTTTVKPSGSEDDLSKLGQTFRGKEASSATASAGARGLDKVSEEYAKRSGISQRDRDTIDRMTAYKITDQEVEDFLKKGELGEYAK
ncbi:MAG TPA: SH3 domain-containing protein [Nitrospirales bacterium]